MEAQALTDGFRPMTSGHVSLTISNVIHTYEQILLAGRQGTQRSLTLSCLHLSTKVLSFLEQGPRHTQFWTSDSGEWDGFYRLGGAMIRILVKLSTCDLVEISTFLPLETSGSYFFIVAFQLCGRAPAECREQIVQQLNVFYLHTSP